MDHASDNNEQKLADQGWAALQATLDRELPVRRKRRRFLWLWWLLPALLAGGGVSWWQYSDQDTPSVAPPPASREEIKTRVAAVPELPQSLSTLKHGGEATVESLQGGADAAVLQGAEPTKPMPGPASLLPTEGYAKTSPDKSGGTVSGHPTVDEADNSDQTVAVSSTTASTPDPTVVQTDVPVFDPASTVNEQPRPYPAPFNSLPGLPLELHLLAGPPPVFPAVRVELGTPPAPPRARENRWALGLTAGLSLRDFSTAPGALLGLTTDFRLSQKWGLRSGLFYGRERLPAASSAVVGLPVAVQYDTTISGNVIIEDITFEQPGVANASYSTVPGRVQATVTRLHRLEMPLLGYWQPLRQWRLYGGGTLAYTLWAETGPQSLINSDNESLDAQGFDSRQALNREATQKTGSWQAGWLSGIGFRPGRGWELNFLAQHLPGKASDSIYSADVDNMHGGFTPPLNETTAQRKNDWRFQLNATLFF